MLLLLLLLLRIYQGEERGLKHTHLYITIMTKKNLQIKKCTQLELFPLMHLLSPTVFDQVLQNLTVYIGYREEYEFNDFF